VSNQDSSLEHGNELECVRHVSQSPSRVVLRTGRRTGAAVSGKPRWQPAPLLPALTTATVLQCDFDRCRRRFCRAQHHDLSTRMSLVRHQVCEDMQNPLRSRFSTPSRAGILPRCLIRVQGARGLRQCSLERGTAHGSVTVFGSHLWYAAAVSFPKHIDPQRLL